MTSAHKDALLPCPFKHEVKRGPYIDVDAEEWDIARGACGDCGAFGPFVDLVDFETHDQAKAEATRLWNIRAKVTP